MRLLLVLLALALLVATACGADDDTTAGSAPADPPTTVSYTIPSGAGASFDAGEPLDILPARIELAVGDSVEIVNEDDRNHLIGPFFVEAGETFEHTFRSVGEFEGECTVHPSGRVVVVVT